MHCLPKQKTPYPAINKPPHLFKSKRSKRPAPAFTAQETEEMMQEAKRMATTYQCKELLDAAKHHQQKEKLLASKPPPKCTICQQQHYASECKLPLEEKMKLIKQRHICHICLTRDKHTPINCKTLRFPQHLCSYKHCGKSYTFHHATICPFTAPTTTNMSPAESTGHDEILD
ncbi:hypothetical protein CRE_25874 [Caenorhabditis remanei]|uniref:Uncharacterized protein n=1 Tax=Caenorhabditis remanei TaxID=31234 RepID=E3NDS5_CAERE|nr:hypothetical protein CRE_25874 [Caenorhabditis remanei]